MCDPSIIVSEIQIGYCRMDAAKQLRGLSESTDSNYRVSVEPYPFLNSRRGASLCAVEAKGMLCWVGDGKGRTRRWTAG